MKMHSVSLVYLWCLVACILQGLKGDDLKVQEERDTVVISCDPERKSFERRCWYSGYFNQKKEIDDDDCLFTQKYGETVDRETERKDMSADETDFNLTIKNVTLKDSHHFTCQIRMKRKFFVNIHVNLEVYIQPEITLIVSPEERIYTEDDNVTAICTIKSVYPELVTNTFFMKWDANTYIQPGEILTHHPDGSLTYTVNYTKTVSKDDTSVYCLVEPQRGIKRLEKWDFSVQYAPKGRPSISFTLQSPMQDDFITFLCNTENVTASVKTFVNWYRNGSPLDWESPGCCAYTKRTDIDDTGNYSCTVGNALGSSPESEPRYLNVQVAPKMFTEGLMVGGVIGGLVIGILITSAAIFLYQRRKGFKENASLGSTDVVVENDYLEPLPTPNIGGTSTRSDPLPSEDVYAQVNKPNKTNQFPPNDLQASEDNVKRKTSWKNRKRDSLMIQENDVYGQSFSKIRAQEAY